MTRGLFAAYGIAVYTAFFGTFLYMVGFIDNLPLLPKTIDSGPLDDPLLSIAVNVALLAVFGIQHSLMARQEFKRAWTRLVPAPIERSTYVLFASLALLLLFWQWRPLPAVVWSAASPLAEVLAAVSWVGWGIVLLSTFLINHFELFGLRQVYARLRGRELPAPEFRTPMLYKQVRHPIYLGFLIAFWATPEMTLGHLLFAIGMTVYIFIGIALEERDLIAMFGDHYRHYRSRVPMLLPAVFRRMPAVDADEGPRRTAP